MSLASCDRFVLVRERDHDRDDRAEDLLADRAASRATGRSTVGANQKPGPSGALPRKATGAPSSRNEPTVAR